MNNEINTGGVTSIVDNVKSYIDLEEIHFKIFKLLNADKFEKLVTFDIKKLIELFEINIDFDCLITEFEDKTIYKYSLNSSGLSKLDQIKSFLSLKNIIENKLTEKFEYKKTIKGLYRYNNNQTKDEFKIPISVNGLDLEILKLNNQLNEDDENRLNDVNDNYLFEKEKEIKYNNLLKELNIILENLDVGSDIIEIVKKFNLSTNFTFEKGLYTKRNLEYILEIKKEIVIDNTLNKKAFTYEKSILEKILKYKKSIIGLVGITGFYILFEKPNTINTNLNFNHNYNLPVTRELDIDKINIKNNNEKNIENHGNILFEGMIFHYIYSLENNLLVNMNSKDFFMHFLNKNYIYHFANFIPNKIKELEVKFNYLKDKNSIKSNGFIILDNFKKYSLLSEFDVQEDSLYQEVGRSEEYLLFKTNYEIFDKTLIILLNDSIKISDYKNNSNYREEIELIIKEKVSDLNIKDIIESNFSSEILGRATIDIVNKVFINEDGKLIIDFSILYKGKTYMYSYRI